MLKKYVVVTLIVLMLNLAFGSSGSAQNIQGGDKIKVKIAEFGTSSRRIDVKYKDKTKARGYISEIKEDYFVIVTKENALTVRIPYNQVSSVSRYHSNALKKIALGTGIVIGAMFLIVGICLAAKSCTE